MKSNKVALTALVAAFALAGCSTMTETNSRETNARLDQARSDYRAAQSDPRVVSLASDELRKAGVTLDRANKAANDRGQLVEVDLADQLAVLAVEQVALAQDAARRRDAELIAAKANAETDRARLGTRTQ